MMASSMAYYTKKRRGVAMSYEHEKIFLSLEVTNGCGTLLIADPDLQELALAKAGKKLCPLALTLIISNLIRSDKNIEAAQIKII